MIEPVGADSFRASGGEPFAISVEAKTQEEALQKLYDVIQGRLKAGARVVHLDVVDENPWLAIAGSLDPSDMLVQEWLQEIKNNRRELDEDPRRP